MVCYKHLFGLTNSAEQGFLLRHSVAFRNLELTERVFEVVLFSFAWRFLIIIPFGDSVAMWSFFAITPPFLKLSFIRIFQIISVFYSFVNNNPFSSKQLVCNFLV